ncbi:AAA family ATPase [Bradyrhizobium sp. STM 3557]|uniref:AAA family ATPase n=1 Tax=Bradyrhizobium sp. STM 3557 TaxID=578920 RepID=UPI00388DD806
MISISPKQLAQALGGDAHGNEVLAPGPGHSPKDRSLSIKLSSDAPGGFVVHSFAGDDPIACRDHVTKAAGLPEWQPERQRPASQSIARMQERVSAQAERKPSAPAEYVYRLGDGTPYLRVKRTADKQFYQQHWTGSAWVNGAPQGPKIPYRLPELLEAEHDTVLIVEGEKDADRLAGLGLLATTNAGGAEKWTSDLNEHFRGRDIFVLPDNDAAGERHAALVTEMLAPLAREIRIVRLPNLPPKGDVSDWLDQGGSVEDLDRLMRSAEKAETRPAVEAPSPLRWLDMSAWDSEPVPERQWSIRDRVPLRQAGLFSGEGGTGKSIIELMKNVAHVIGRDWLGSLPEQGPAFYLGAEDDKDEIHIRLSAIGRHFNVTFREMMEGGLHVLPLLGQDATLCALTRGGNVEVTPLYKQIYEAAGDIKPKNISIDTLSRAFSGNEIDRVQVYAFAMHMQALAMVAGGSVTVLSHPSLQGINSGSGLSGSTAWHGAFRFRQYLKGVKGSDGEQPDNDLRQLEFKKNQYGPLGENIVLRYQNGLFLPESGISNLDQIARRAKAEEVFLDLLRRFSSQDRNVSDKPAARNYAPAEFAKEKEAKDLGLRKAALEQAMRDLFSANRIAIEQYDKPSRGLWRLKCRP